jgi:alpha-galactosidase
MHRLINDYLLPKTWAMVNPPIIINTWEALYYNVNHTNVMQLAQQVYYNFKKQLFLY